MPPENSETADAVEAQILAFGDDDTPEIIGENENVSQDERRYLGWNDVLPDDPSLPQTYRGQRTFSDVWRERTELAHEVNRKGQLLNEREAELQAQRATIKLLTEQLGSGQPQRGQQPDPNQFVDASDIDFERELLVDANGAMQQFAQRVAEATERRVLERVGGTVGQLQQKLSEQEANAFVDTMAQASYSVAQELGIPTPVWDSRVKDMMSSIWKEAQDMRAFHDPDWWRWAHDDAGKRWGASSSEQTQPARGQFLGNPGTNTRSAGIRTSAKALPARLQKQINQYASEFGVDPAKLEAEVRADYEAGRIR